MALKTAFTPVHGGNIFAVCREYGWDWREIADFSASINPLGPAPGVMPAIQDAVERIVHYPDRECCRLRALLAETWKVDEDQLLLGNGASELIFFVARMFGAKPVVLATPVFTEFHRAFPAAGEAALAEPVTWLRSGALVVTRPANPTGQSVSLQALEERLQATEEPVLVDESFLEYSGHASSAALIRRFPQLLVLRSLTKFYALPGIRVGALVGGAATLREWKRHREPWQVSVLAEEAALAAVGDAGHAARSREFMLGERAWLRDQLRLLRGVEVAESDANFLYARLAYGAAGLTEHMLTRRILIRDCSHWPGLTGEAARVAVRTRAENERLLRAWRDFECV